MKKIQMYFDEDALIDLKEYAKKEGKSYSEVVRELVEQFRWKLKEKQMKKKNWVDEALEAAEPGPPGGDSMKIDEILYS